MTRARRTWSAFIAVAPWIALGVMLAALFAQRQTIIEVQRQVVTITNERDHYQTAADGASRQLRRLRRERVLVRLAAAHPAPRIAGDAALSRAQAANAARFARAAPRIVALASARPTGNADTDAAAVAKDSRAPWEGWR